MRFRSPTRYPVEELDPDSDNGTMPDNVKKLESTLIGQRIARTKRSDGKLVITLQNGREVILVDNSDCCAYTVLEDFLLNPELVQHAILGVGTTDGYETWHIFADFGDIMTLKVGWSCGNPFYYSYGFNIAVRDP